MDILFAAHGSRGRRAACGRFESESRVGVVSVIPQDYDPARWWASSLGITDITVELLKWAFELALNSAR